MGNKEVIQKLRVELEQLRQKIMNLEIFILTKKFIKLEIQQQDLLVKQKDTMLNYQIILMKRIALIQNLIDKEGNND